LQLPKTCSHITFNKYTEQVHCVSKNKNDTDVAHYNFDPDQPILTILAGNGYEV